MEVLIGTVIIAVALTALALTFSQGTQNTVDSRNRLQALSVAQQELEGLKRYSTLTALTASLPAGKNVQVAGIDYTVNGAIISVTAVNSYTTLKPVQLTVSWPPGQSLQIVEYLLVN